MRRLLLLLLFLSALAIAAYGVQRFPPPQFDTPHPLPQTSVPPPRAGLWVWIDSAALLLALSAASWLTLKKRRRGWIAAMMIASLLYFGFWRKGCVCSVGSIGNIALSAFQSDYAVPIVVLFFFMLPLVFTLFFGRGFCAAVCPLGAMQDIVLIHPLKVPRGLESGLRLLAYLYLGLAVLMAATASAFIICRYDPFVGFWRFDANWNLWVLGASFLAIATVVGRPYCRFLCPYGVLLRQLSRLSPWRVTITPDECIQCRLCEDACPFGAIEAPAAAIPKKHYVHSKQRLALLIVLIPILAAVGGWIGVKAHLRLAQSNPTVALSNLVAAYHAGTAQQMPHEIEAFVQSGLDAASLRQAADAVINQFYIGSAILGILLGLLVGIKAAAAMAVGRNTDYEAHRAGCFACGRCFAYCPREQKIRLSAAEDTKQ